MLTWWYMALPGVHCVAPHVWYKTNSLQTLDTLHDLIMDHLERQSIKMADYVISPTEYMLNWMEENGWPLNRTKTAIHPNLLPAWVQRRTRVLNEVGPGKCCSPRHATHSALSFLELSSIL